MNYYAGHYGTIKVSHPSSLTAISCMLRSWNLQKKLTKNFTKPNAQICASQNTKKALLYHRCCKLSNICLHTSHAGIVISQSYFLDEMFATTQYSCWACGNTGEAQAVPKWDNHDLNLATTAMSAEIAEAVVHHILFGILEAQPSWGHPWLACSKQVLP